MQIIIKPFYFFSHIVCYICAIDLRKMKQQDKTWSADFWEEVVVVRIGEKLNSLIVF